MIAILLILLTLCLTYIAHLKTKLEVAEHNLNDWRDMIVFFNGKKRLLNG